VTVKVRGSGGVFGSVPVSVMPVAVSCGTSTVCGLAVGPPLTVMETVAAVLLKPKLFVTVNVKLSAPTKLFLGV